LLNEADAQRYNFLAQQTDLTLTYRGPNLALFENQAWHGSDLPLGPADSAAFTWGDAGAATERLIPMDARASMSGTGFDRVGRILPGWRSIGPVLTVYVSTGERCTDGWQLGEQAPVCHLGAVATFSSPGQAEELWRPAAGARVVGLLITGLALIGVLVSQRVGRPTSSSRKATDP
jgi:hypothetical protein